MSVVSTVVGPATQILVPVALQVIALLSGAGVAVYCLMRVLIGAGVLEGWFQDYRADIAYRRDEVSMGHERDKQKKRQAVDEWRAERDWVPPKRSDWY